MTGYQYKDRGEKKKTAACFSKNGRPRDSPSFASVFFIELTWLQVVLWQQNSEEQGAAACANGLCSAEVTQDETSSYRALGK